MWKKGWSWRAGLGTLERENEKKLICGLVVAMRIRVYVVVGQAKRRTGGSR
jgi:hypothetical protein